jgi:Glu-tRNA(Gln) amidotransferase subunit E-like FAD-binding protein
MNFFQCPFESNNNNQYPYTKQNLFALQRLAFAIEQAISIFHETTKNNEIIYEVDFENDRVQEIHTNYNGEPYSWGWNNNVNEILSKVKSISTIQIINEQDLYNILTNREKIEFLLQEYYNEEQQQQGLEQIKKELKEQIRAELQKQNEEQKILLSNENSRQNIIDFIINNNDSIRIEDLKIYEPVYKCYRKKGHCHICNSLSNIICMSCSSHSYIKEEIWLCTNHWQQHKIEKHE